MGFVLREAKALWPEISNVGVGTYASSIAYFTFLSLIPLLTLTISIVTLTGSGESEVVEFFSAIVPDTFADFAKTLIGDAFKQSGIAFSLSTVTLLWTASKGVRALHAGLNAAYGEQENRGAAVIAAMSIGATVALGVLFAATICLVFGGNAMRAIAPLVGGLEQRGDAMNILNSMAMSVLGIVVLAACYTYLPSGPRRFRSQLPGAALGSVACGVLTVGFHVYIDNFCNFHALYGSIATIALFLFWIYLVAYIVLAGALANRILACGRTDSVN